MAQMCENLDCFDVAGHYDYINRYNPVQADAFFTTTAQRRLTDFSKH